jgi:hypothetical protein
MSEVSNAVAIYGLQASLATEQTNASGIVPVGPSQTQRTFLEADVAYAFRANLPNVGDVAVVDLTDASGEVTPAIPTGTPAPEGFPQYIQVTGTFTDSTGSNTQSIPVLLVHAGTNLDGVRMWSTTGDFESDWISLGLDANGQSFAAIGIPTVNALFNYRTSGGTSSFEDSSATDILTADWVASNDETGQPILSEIEIESPELIDADGKDIYGQPIPTVDEINGLLIECVSGAATITGADGFEYSPTANAVLQISNTSTGVITPDDLTIEATAADTAVKVTVIGKTAP